MTGFSAIGLDNPKFDVNVGSAMRAAGIYGASFIAYSGKRVKPGKTDTMKHNRKIPLFRVSDLKEVIPYNCVPVAVEIAENAQSLITYAHPKRAFYIFGGEDATLGSRILSWCRDIIYVPTNGCMNLAATVNVILYDRMVKEYLYTRKGK